MIHHKSHMFNVTVMLKKLDHIYRIFKRKNTDIRSFCSFLFEFSLYQLQFTNYNHNSQISTFIPEMFVFLLPQGHFQLQNITTDSTNSNFTHFFKVNSLTVPSTQIHNLNTFIDAYLKSTRINS